MIKFGGHDVLKMLKFSTHGFLLIKPLNTPVIKKRAIKIESNKCRLCFEKQN